MSLLNTTLRYYADRATKAPSHVTDLTDEFARKSNAPFFAAVAAAIRKLSDSAATAPYFTADGMGCIGLIGQYGLASYMVRQAQAVLRYDHTPSYWSHAFLIAGGLTADPGENRSARSAPWIWESTLTPPGEYADFSMRNGVSPRRLSSYDRAGFRAIAEAATPNVAVIAIGLLPQEREELMKRASNPKPSQLAYDLPQLQASWFNYIASRTERRNPLQDGIALPGAAFIQLAYEAASIDLSPGGHQRNPSMEHIWQTVKYLSDHLPKIVISENESVDRPIHAWICVRDRGGLMAPPESMEETHWTHWTLADLTKTESAT